MPLYAKATFFRGGFEGAAFAGAGVGALASLRERAFSFFLDAFWACSTSLVFF
jgi:hypothetical protein